ncbi:MAG: hypothetical protein R2856_37750 [Caldilineaceae bacterium]
MPLRSAIASVDAEISLFAHHIETGAEIDIDAGSLLSVGQCP